MFFCFSCSLNTMAKKLNETEEILSLERGEAVQKTEIIKRLEFDLEEMRTNLDKQKTKFEAENNNSKLLAELAELQSVENNLENEKANLESRCSQLLKVDYNN